MNIGVHTPAQWQAFCTAVLDRPELATDRLYNTNERRVTNRASLEPLVDARLGTLQADAVMATLEAVDIPYGVINDVAGLAGHVQLAARERWFEVDSPSGPIRALVPPFNLSGAESNAATRNAGSAT